TIFFIRDRLQPYCPTYIGIRSYGNMCHGFSRGSSMPMLYVWRAFYHFAFFNNLYRLPSFLIQTFSFRYQEYLPSLVIVPVGPCSRFKSDRSDVNMMGRISFYQIVEPNSADEIIIGYYFSFFKSGWYLWFRPDVFR